VYIACILQSCKAVLYFIVLMYRVTAILDTCCSYCLCAYELIYLLTKLLYCWELYVSIGTGKTLVGVKIAYLFMKMNEFDAAKGRSGAKKQVLFCGPSNSSVDVAGMMNLWVTVTGYMKRKTKVTTYQILWNYCISVNSDCFCAFTSVDCHYAITCSYYYQ